MSTSSRYLFKGASVLFTVASVFVFASHASAADSKRKNPTSKLYIADIEGIASINTGEKIEDLTKKSVYAAEGVILQTNTGSNNAMVLSNGTGVFFDPDTRLEMKRFMQEPFSPNRTDLEVEPSISQTNAFLPKGTVGLCTSKMVAGSTMTYTTRHANVTIRGRKVVIETNDNETTVSMIEGESTVRGDMMAGGESLKNGQQAVITRRSASEPPTIKIQPIPQADVKRLGDKVAMACMARKTVYFETSERKNQNAADGIFSQSDGTAEQIIVPVQVLPGRIPTDNTVSANKIIND